MLYLLFRHILGQKTGIEIDNYWKREYRQKTKKSLHFFTASDEYARGIHMRMVLRYKCKALIGCDFTTKLHLQEENSFT